MQPEIKDLLEYRDLTRIEKFIEKYISPCVVFALAKTTNSLPVGASKFGGNPDLPDDFVWFKNKGRPLDFLLQINLAEASKFDKSRLLPSQGLLSFFYDLEKQPWGYDPDSFDSFKVLYLPAISELSAKEAPNSEYKFEEFEIKLKAGLTVPDTNSFTYSMLEKEAELTRDEGSDYLDFTFDFSDQFSSFTPEGARHHLLGHSQNVQGDLQTEAQLVTHGYYCSGNIDYKDPEIIRLKEDSGKWTVLLQLSSDEKGGFDWVDGGTLYYLIRKDDLIERNFDKVWMGLQCS